ncbi:MAG: hypothetical protein E7378_03070 [Clostridiales bacterium]|nr:hypothetical protein [Clostridiales bacterium]
MSQITLKNIWDLRGKLDNIICSKDYKLIQGVKDQYKSLLDNDLSYNHIFSPYWHFMFPTYQAENIDNNKRKRYILSNIEDFEKKYLYGEDISIKFKKPSSLAEDVWILRAMFDKFMLRGSTCKDTQTIQENMILGKAIIEKIETLMDRATEVELDELSLIESEIQKGYKCLYGDNKVNVDYDSLVDEFLEK